MLNFFRILAFIFLFLPTESNTTNISITMDDHPLPPTSILSAQERNANFLKALDAHNCQAVFFCVGKHCIEQDDPYLLLDLLKHGHSIANHSYSHRHLSKISITDFEAELIANEQTLCNCSMQKWFRYPYLDYGNRKETGGSFRKAYGAYRVLKKHGYKEGYVTINTFDWHINAKLLKAINEDKVVDYDALKETYLSLIKEWCEFYINYYQSLGFGDITHTLLLHANDINGLYLGDILNMIQEAGWNLASPQEAFNEAKWRKKFLKISRGKTPSPSTLNTAALDEKLKKIGL
ncbi:polysaccharide deacetylase family protein [bacterium]|jgi:peptidoglycan-N-acetylglucosamine deacetylase|nr:polysaccharide deacetylase family protein [bacterium]MBT5015480.1 polysaccharide deacetylase family protein [bacterium]